MMMMMMMMMMLMMMKMMMMMMMTMFLLLIREERMKSERMIPPYRSYPYLMLTLFLDMTSSSSATDNVNLIPRSLRRWFCVTPFELSS